LIVFPLEKKVLMKKLKVLIVRDGPQIVISVSLKHHIYIERERERRSFLIYHHHRFVQKLFIIKCSCPLLLITGLL
jgi:hypothetical protein